MSFPDSHSSQVSREPNPALSRRSMTSFALHPRQVERLTLLLHVKYKISFMVFAQRNLVKFTVLQYQGIKFPLKSGFSWFSVPFHSIVSTNNENYDKDIG